jgi:hypothetical protein
MKKLLATACFGVVAGFLLQSSGPSPAQAAQGTPQELEARVAKLEGELATEKLRHDETRTLMMETLAYLEKQSRAAQALLLALDESERQGFAVGENWPARKTLLAGLRAYWNEEQGVPKAPTAAKAPAPAAPTRAKAPLRQ